MTQRSRVPRKGERGFSLLEVLITAGIFGIGILGVTGMFGAVAQGTAVANDISLATNLAAARVDTLELQDFAILSAALPATLTTTYNRSGGLEADADKVFYTVTTSLTNADGTVPPRLIDVAVNVTWDHGKGRSVQLMSRIAQ